MNFKFAMRVQQVKLVRVGHKAFHSGKPDKTGMFFTVLMDRDDVEVRWWDGKVWSIPGTEKDWKDKTGKFLPKSLFTNEILWCTV